MNGANAHGNIYQALALLFMYTGEAYNKWSQTYDDVDNRTRDLESVAIRTVLQSIGCQHIIELGCGTGKNTGWLSAHCQQLTALDFSEGMLEQARAKITDGKVTFHQVDITTPWKADIAELICCSLVLEHIRDLDFIFSQARSSLINGGSFYICELHPYRQMLGAHAKFRHEGSVLHLEYFVHHISDYIHSAISNGFRLADLREWFDDDLRNQPPRLISYLFIRL